jgi:predicted O-methyltransferase YrrM
MNEYTFSTDWFQRTCEANWTVLMPKIRPKRILEIGSYEGASTCFLMEKLASQYPIELHCIDTWEGGIEHQAGGSAQADMGTVERNFRSNIEYAQKSAAHPVEIHIHKGYSHRCLSKLLASGHESRFDFIYVDGSHQAPDVLCDAVLAFKLLEVGGTLGFDDYLWTDQIHNVDNPLLCPKPGIDAFININSRKLKIIPMPLYQLYVQKLGD